ncbi:uridine kinase family protein [Legionella fairfieldensis]|uniref:uridine kinase family protein n=1 Tax=Legionella fairfieldensis TaxID=45064 RepID=UPI00048E0184|nr:AAA family ATPase [Legionella fairfieldensis]
MLFIFIAGASGSGKTEFSERLVKKLAEDKYKAVMLSMDHYYKTKIARQKTADPTNFDTPEALDIELFHEHLCQLEQNITISRPTYCFERQDRLDTTESVNPKELDVIIVEGIFALHNLDKLQLTKITVFIENDWFLSYRGRRSKRDEKERGVTPEETKKKGRIVDAAFFKTVLPQKNNVDIILDNNNRAEDKLSYFDRLISEDLMPFIRNKSVLSSDCFYLSRG